MLEIKYATLDYLPQLKEITIDIVENMHNNKIDIWNNYYPSEEFQNYIEQRKLYVVTQNNNELIGYFALNDKDPGEEKFSWKYNGYKYIEMFALSVKYLHMGYARQILILIINLLKKKKYNSLRLTVYEKNYPAINLYKKMGFQLVDGQYVFRNIYNDEPPKTFFGMEINLDE